MKNKTNILELMERKLVPMANVLNTNKIIQAVSKGLISLTPILMLGSFATLFKQLPVQFYQDFIISAGISHLLQAIIYVTNNMLGIYATFAIAYAYINAEEKDGYIGGFLALCSLMLMTPMSTTGEGLNVVTNLPLSWLGAKGLFSAIIVALLVSKIYCFLINKNFTIKLPDSVPTYVSKSFAGIVPGIVIFVVFSIISLIFTNTEYGSFHNAVYTIIAQPLSHLGGTIWAALLIYFLSGLCWFCGIHGIAVISAILPIWMAADITNKTLIAAGQAPTEIITYNWVNAVGGVGAAGCTLGLMILCVFFAKSKRYKEFGKIGIVPNIFNINEPVVFGLPCMLNPILAIPFVLLPVIFIGIAYVLTITGILPIGNGVGAPGGTPVILAGMFTGGWRLAIWQFITIVISVFAYLPFFRVLDKQAVEEEEKLLSE